MDFIKIFFEFYQIVKSPFPSPVCIYGIHTHTLCSGQSTIMEKGKINRRNSILEENFMAALNPKPSPAPSTWSHFFLLQRTTEQTNKRTNKQTNKQTNEQTNKRTNKYCLLPFEDASLRPRHRRGKHFKLPNCNLQLWTCVMIQMNLT